MNRLGKFEILGKVGQGAMGVVYKARDAYIGRSVALKTITTGLNENPDLVKRFYNEAQSAGRLQHPNIVTIFELGNEGDTPFIAMEFLTGESLDKLIANKPAILLSQKVGYIVHVCRALDYAHRQDPPVIHRDIKPGNVMVTIDGTVKVVDFGIARLGEGTRSQSSGMLIGTLAYMSPQQFRGGGADQRADIWATGVMFYELLCYNRPFDGNNPGALMSAIILDKHQPISDAAPGTPPEVEAVIDRMLAKEIERRYQTMEEVLLDLEPIWRELQRSEVAQLIESGQRSFEAGDLVKAQDLFRQVIQLDTANTHAKSLFEKVNAEVRRNQVVPQLKAYIDKGQSFLAAGQIEDAKAQIESALRLDSAYQPARELLAQAEAAAEKKRQIAQELRNSKQRLAEGAITEAELHLEKALSIEPSNPIAQDLRKHIQEEKARRERQKRLSETLHRARTLWTNLQYNECIAVLLEAQKEYPNQPEIARLLETARQDQSEQERQAALAQARDLVSKQRFEDALQALDRILEKSPSDTAARNLQTLAQQGRERELQDQRLKESLASLRALVDQKKYQDVVKQGENLLQEFPGEFEITELIRFARGEQAQADQKQRLDNWVKRVQQAVKEARFQEAIQTAQKGLAEFPQNVDLLILSDRAKKEQAEKEKQELIKKRLKEVQTKIDRQELGDAIDLARETLVTVGPNSVIADVLHKAEMEFNDRKKKQDQKQTVLMARTLLDGGKLSEATGVLNEALATQLFSPDDGRVSDLLKEIDAKKKAATPPEKVPVPSAKVIAPPVSPSAPPAQSAKGNPSVSETIVAQRPQNTAHETVLSPLNATIVGATLDQSAPTIAAGPGSSMQATMVVPPPVQAPKKESRVPIEKPKPQPVVVEVSKPELPNTEAPKTKRPAWQLGAIAAAVVLVVLVSLYFAIGHRGNPERQAANVTTPTSGAQTASESTPPVPQQQPQSPPTPIQVQNNASSGVKPEQPIQQSGQVHGPVSQPSPPGQPADDHRNDQVWAQAVAAFQQNNFDEAQRDFQTIASSADSSRKPEAQNYLRVMIPNRRKEEQLFAEAQSLRTSNDAASLNKAQDDLRQVIALNGPREQTARDLLTDVSTRISELSNQQAQQNQFNQLVQQFKTADSSKDRQALLQLQANFRKFENSNGAVSGDAQNYAEKLIPDELSKIDAASKASIPTPPPVKPANAPTDEIKIQQVLQIYAQAFQTKDKLQLRHIWPTLSDKQFKDMQGSFKDAQSIRLTVTPSAPANVTGNNATVSCTQIAEITAGGQTQQLTNGATFYLEKLGGGDGDWVINRIDYSKKSR